MCSKIPAVQNEGICIVPVGRGGGGDGREQYT